MVPGARHDRESTSALELQWSRQGAGGSSVPMVWSGTGPGPGLWSGPAVVWSTVRQTLRTGLTVRSSVFGNKDHRTRTGPLIKYAYECASILQGCGSAAVIEPVYGIHLLSESLMFEFHHVHNTFDIN
jgi:hypothetical protein